MTDNTEEVKLNPKQGEQKQGENQQQQGENQPQQGENQQLDKNVDIAKEQPPQPNKKPPQRKNNLGTEAEEEEDTKPDKKETTENKNKARFPHEHEVRIENCRFCTHENMLRLVAGP